MRSLLVVAVLAALAQAGPAVQLSLNRTGALPFFGVGALSGGGGTSRWLEDYSLSEQEAMLDLLFLPGSEGGAGLQVLKIEIGGDTWSTQATEESIEHYRGEVNCSAGYEMQLAKRAAARNPRLQLYGLSWGVPGWIGNGTEFFSQDNIDYQVRWLQCMRSAHQLNVSWIGVWNERPWDAPYLSKLRGALDAAGFGQVGIVGGDNTGWRFVDDAMNDDRLFGSVAAFSSHYPLAMGGFLNATTQRELQRRHMPLMASEDWSLSVRADWGGAMQLAETLNRNVIDGGIGCTVVWTLMYSWSFLFGYADPPAAGAPVGGLGHGLVYAAEPWSNHWAASPPLFALMHTSLYTEPAWVIPAGGRGRVDNATFVSYRDTAGDHFSVVIETSGMLAAANVSFRLADWTSYSNQLPLVLKCHATNSTSFFQPLAPVPLDATQSFTLELEPQGIISCSTRTAPAPLRKYQNGASQQFPFPYEDNFDDYPDGSLARYLTAEGGFFSTAPGGPWGGAALKQKLTIKPIPWYSDPNPVAYIGDARADAWQDYTVSLRAAIAGGQEHRDTYVMLCGRVASFDSCKPTGRDSECPPPHGYCLRVGLRSWMLMFSTQKLASGNVTASQAAGYDLSLAFAKDSLNCSIDGNLVATVTTVNSSFGAVALGSGWHQAWFSGLAIKAAARAEQGSITERTVTAGNVSLVQLGEVYPDGFQTLDAKGDQSVLFGKGVNFVYSSQDGGLHWSEAWAEDYIDARLNGFPQPICRDNTGIVHNLGSAGFTPNPGVPMKTFGSEQATAFSMNGTRGVEHRAYRPSRAISFESLPIAINCSASGPGACWWLTGSSPRGVDLTHVEGSNSRHVTTSVVNWLGGSRGGTKNGSGIFAWASNDTYHWEYRGTVALASDFPETGEGPNEHDITLLADHKTLAVVFRIDAGDGWQWTSVPYKNYHIATSIDYGISWSTPGILPGAMGCARPRLHLMRPGGPLLLTGGRARNHGSSDISLWINWDGMAGTWEPAISITGWHNMLTSEPSLRFSPSVNGTDARETDSYTSILPLSETKVVITYNRKAGWFYKNTTVPVPSSQCQARLDSACNNRSIPQVATCLDSISAENKSLPLYARRDTDAAGGPAEWRCYSASSLDANKQHYLSGDAYCTMPALLSNVAHTCGFLWGCGAIFSMQVNIGD